MASLNYLIALIIYIAIFSLAIVIFQNKKLGKYPEPLKKSSSPKKDFLEISLLYIIMLIQNHFATLQNTEEILRYDADEGIYVYGGEAFIKAKIQTNLAEGIVTRQLCEEVIGHIRRSTYHKRSEFNSDPNILILENCVLDLEDMTTRPHDPDDLALTKKPLSLPNKTEKEIKEDYKLEL